MTFATRMETARAHEQAVIDALEGIGWLAEPFGQALLTEHMRDAIKRATTPVRWLPDIVGFHTDFGAYFFDAKTGRNDTPNYALEQHSVDALVLLEAFAPVLFVFSDMRYLSPSECVEHGRRRSGTARGSGTPMLLVEKTHAHDLFADLHWAAA